MADNIYDTPTDDQWKIEHRIRLVKQRVALLNIHITEEAEFIASHEGIRNNELPSTYREKLERRESLLNELATLESQRKSLEA